MPPMRRKGDLPEKICAQCGRPFARRRVGGARRRVGGAGAGGAGRVLLSASLRAALRRRSRGALILTAAVLARGERLGARFVAAVALPAPSACGRIAETERETDRGALSSLPPRPRRRGEECATSCSPLASAVPQSEELGGRGDKGCVWDG